MEVCGDGIDFRPKAKYAELTDAVLGERYLPPVETW